MGFYKNTHSGVHAKKEKIYDELLKISHSIPFPRSMLHKNIILEGDGGISLIGSINLKSNVTELPCNLNHIYGSFTIRSRDNKLVDINFPLDKFPKRVDRWLTIYGKPKYTKEDILDVVEMKNPNKIIIM